MQKLYLAFSKYYYLPIVFLAVFIPLYPKIPFMNVMGTYVAIRFEDLLIALIFLIWLVANISKLKGYFSENIYKAFILFWLIGALSLISGIFITYSVDPKLGMLHFFRRVEYMSLFIMAATSLNSFKKVKILVITSFLTSLIVVAYGFGQIWLNFPVISTTNSEFSKGLVLYLSNGARVNSTFAGHYDLAVYISMILVMIAGLFIYSKNIMFKGSLFLLGALNFVLLGFTAARVSFVATLLGMAWVFWLSKRKILLVGLFISALALVAIIPDLRHRLVATVTVNIMGGGGEKYNPPPDKITIFTPKSQRVGLDNAQPTLSSATESGAIAVDTVAGEPINTTELGVYRSTGIRLNVEWPRALNAFYKNPFLGTGYSSLNIATDNDILRSLGETGLLGTGSLALIFFIIIKRILAFIKTNSNFEGFFAISSLTSIVVVFITAIFIDVLEASKIAEFFWLILGAAWAVVTGYGMKGKENEKI